jgi:hypothetical protein
MQAEVMRHTLEEGISVVMVEVEAVVTEVGVEEGSVEEEEMGVVVEVVVAVAKQLR